MRGCHRAWCSRCRCIRTTTWRPPQHTPAPRRHRQRLGLPEPDDVEIAFGVPPFAKVGLQPAEISWRDIQAGGCCRHDPVPSGGAIQRPTRRQGGRDPDRHPGPLDGQLEGLAFDLVVDAAVGHRTATQQCGQHLQAFVELGRSRPRIGAVAERCVVRKEWIARTDTEDDTSAGQMVERDHLAGKLGDMSAGHRRNEGTEQNALGGHRHGRQRDPRVSGGFAELKVVPDEEAVPAGQLCLCRKSREHPSISAEVEVRGVEAVFHREKA